MNEFGSAVKMCYKYFEIAKSTYVDAKQMRF